MKNTLSVVNTKVPKVRDKTLFKEERQTETNLQQKKNGKTAKETRELKYMEHRCTELRIKTSERHYTNDTKNITGRERGRGRIVTPVPWYIKGADP